MNRNRNPNTLGVIPLVAFLVLAALPANGANQDVATMRTHGGSVSFAPHTSFEEMTLTVAGRGHVATQSVRSGQSVSFAPVDSEGYQLPDGTYNWELVTSPSIRDLNPRAFKNGTVSANGRSAEAAVAPAGKRQSGVFTIKNGSIVDAGLVEAESARAVGSRSAATAPSAAARSAEHADQDGQ